MGNRARTGVGGRGGVATGRGLCGEEMTSPEASECWQFTGTLGRRGEMLGRVALSSGQSPLFLSRPGPPGAGAG